MLSSRCPQGGNSVFLGLLFTQPQSRYPPVSGTPKMTDGSPVPCGKGGAAKNKSFKPLCPQAWRLCPWRLMTWFWVVNDKASCFLLFNTHIYLICVGNECKDNARAMTSGYYCLEYRHAARCAHGYKPSASERHVPQPKLGGWSDRITQITNRVSHFLNLKHQAMLSSFQFNLNIISDFWNTDMAEIGTVPYEQLKFKEIWPKTC